MAKNFRTLCSVFEELRLAGFLFIVNFIRHKVLCVLTVMILKFICGPKHIRKIT